MSVSIVFVVRWQPNHSQILIFLMIGQTNLWFCLQVLISWKNMVRVSFCFLFTLNDFQKTKIMVQNGTQNAIYFVSDYTYWYRGQNFESRTIASIWTTNSGIIAHKIDSLWTFHFNKVLEFVLTSFLHLCRLNSLRRIFREVFLKFSFLKAHLMARPIYV